MLHNFIALSPNPYEATQPRNTLTPTASVVFVTIVGVLLCGCVLRTWSIAELHLRHPWAAPASFAAFPLAAIACSDSAAKLASRHREFVHDGWHFMMCAVAFAATYSVCLLATLSGRTPPPRPTTSHFAHAHTSSTDLTTTDAYSGAITLWVQRDEESPLDVVTWFVIQAACAAVCTVVLISLTQLSDGNDTREHDDDVPAEKADARAPIKIGPCVRHPFKSGYDIGGRDYDVTGDGSIAVVDAYEGYGNIYFTFYQRRDDEWCPSDSIIVGTYNYNQTGQPPHVNVRVSQRSGAKITTWVQSNMKKLYYTLIDKDNNIVVQEQDANIVANTWYDVAIDDKGAAVIAARRINGEAYVDVVFIDDRGREARRMAWPLPCMDSTVKVALNPTTGDGIVLAQQQSHGPWPHKCNMYYRRFSADVAAFDHLVHRKVFPPRPPDTWIDVKDREVVLPPSMHGPASKNVICGQDDCMVGMNEDGAFVIVVFARDSGTALYQMIVKLFNREGDEVKTETIDTKNTNGHRDKTRRHHTVIPLRQNSFLIGECYSHSDPQYGAIGTSGKNPMRVFEMTPSGDFVWKMEPGTDVHCISGHTLRTDLAGNLFSRVDGNIFVMDVPPSKNQLLLP